MFDPALLHPYATSPAAAPRARADCQRVLQLLNQQARPGDTLSGLADRLSSAAERGHILAAGGAVVGLVALATVLTGLGFQLDPNWAVGGFGLGLGGLAVAVTEKFRSDRLDRDAALLKGWDQAISQGNPVRFPIPAHEGAMGWPYVEYCEHLDQPPAPKPPNDL